jgi:hypothetical protein
MSPSKAHQRVREYLKGILLEPGTTSSAEAIRLLRDRHSRDLTQATPSLLDSALKAEISKIGSKSGLLGNTELPPTDLFATYQKLPTSFALHDVQGEGGTLARRSPWDATIGDAKAWWNMTVERRSAGAIDTRMSKG